MRWVWLLGFVLLACTQVPPQCAGDQYDIDSCLLDLAFSENESSYCKQIDNEQWQVWCYTDVAANTFDADLCDNLEGDFKNNCAKNVAIAENDPTLCPIGTLPGDECYRQIAVNLENPDLCANIVSVDKYNDCNVDLAEDLKRFSLCLNIRNDVQRYDTCLFRISLSEKNMDGCVPINNQQIQDVCYMNHAVQQMDASICEQAGSVSGACRQAVALEIDKRG